jgi:hypothetical protein
VKSRATPRFWAAYRDLPADVQETARKAYRLFRDNPQHPSLQFKKVHSREPIYSCESAWAIAPSGSWRTTRSRGFGSEAIVSPSSSPHSLRTLRFRQVVRGPNSTRRTASITMSAAFTRCPPGIVWVHCGRTVVARDALVMLLDSSYERGMTGQVRGSARHTSSSSLPSVNELDDRRCPALLCSHNAPELSLTFAPVPDPVL